tara:strand:+ start:11180 stop:12538 length:1359 start_codon:yes stop_codon:yes gene_type:complete
MKIETSEAKIRQAVNEELLKRALTKSLRESKFPTYTAWLGAEILTLEWNQKLQESNTEQQPSPEWIAETASAFGLSDAEIAEATELMNSQELNEIGGFLKAVAKPYQNMWQTFTNITQQAVDASDPKAKKAAQTLDKIDDKLPEPEEVVQTAKTSPEELGKLMKQLIALLQQADQAVNLDDIQPGLEDKVDQAQDSLEQGAEDALEDAGVEGGGKEAFVYKGKGGKGLQSFLARGASKGGVSLKGPAMGAVLKHIAKQLKAQGMTVNESVLDEVQGWIWYGLVERELQESTGTSITIQDILNEFQPNRAAQYRGKELKRKRQGKADRKAAKGQDVGNLGREKPAAKEEPAAGEIKTVKPTVKNTAPADAPVVKVFRGKDGVGLQSALARSRDKLGIDQQTVAVIIKSVEQWAQANQIRVESIDDAGWDTIVSEIAIQRKARKLQETINKLKS